MRAVDTNILVRYLVPADDPAQAAQAAAIIDRGNILIPSTVLLETEWVLRGYYGFSRTQIAEALRRVAGLAGVRVEHPGRLLQAIEWLMAGMDFADVFHLASASECEAFITFDKELVERSRGLSEIPVTQP